MSTEHTPSPAEDPAGNLSDLLIDLDFTPAWAKSTPQKITVEKKKNRPEGRSGDKRAPFKRPAGDKPRSFNKKFEKRPYELPRGSVKVHLLPTKERLARVARLLRSRRRAYALSDLAEKFISDPNAHMIKLTIENPDKYPNLKFYQSKAGRAAFMNREACERYVMKHVAPEFYEVEEIEKEAPSGNFPGINRCKKTGTLLGPPNHHSYGEALEEFRTTRFPALSIDQLKKQMEMVRDEEIVNTWKQEQTKQVIFRVKENPNGVMSKKEMEAHFIEHYLAKDIVEGIRCIVSPPAQKSFGDKAINSEIKFAYQREAKNPFTLSIALRPALKSMKLHIFRTGKKDFFVTSVVPAPLSEDSVVAEIAEVLSHLRQHPGCTREELLAALKEGAAIDSAEAVAVFTPLSWLLERGHVIEFYNGSMAVPKGQKRD